MKNDIIFVAGRSGAGYLLPSFEWRYQNPVFHLILFFAVVKVFLIYK